VMQMCNGFQKENRYFPGQILPGGCFCHEEYANFTQI